MHAPEAKFRDPTATGTILDNDRIQISIADAPPVTEGSGQPAEFTVTMTPPQTADLTIQWKTEDGLSGGQTAATGGADYTAQGATSLTFSAGETEKTITVPVLNDSDAENTEEFRVVISGDTSMIFFLWYTGYAEIEDDDAKDFLLLTPLPEGLSPRLRGNRCQTPTTAAPLDVGIDALYQVAGLDAHDHGAAPPCPQHPPSTAIRRTAAGPGSGLRIGLRR